MIYKTVCIKKKEKNKVAVLCWATLTYYYLPIQGNHAFDSVAALGFYIWTKLINKFAYIMY